MAGELGERAQIALLHYQAIGGIHIPSSAWAGAPRAIDIRGRAGQEARDDKQTRDRPRHGPGV
jgi:hypothetical protein